MELDISTLRTDDRDGGGVATPEPVGCESLTDSRTAMSVPSEQQATHSFYGMYEAALNDALRECQLMKDYEKASSRWSMVSRMALKMGAPVELVLDYGDRLMAHYESLDGALVKVDVKSPGNQIVGRQNNNYHPERE